METKNISAMRVKICALFITVFILFSGLSSFAEDEVTNSITFNKSRLFSDRVQKTMYLYVALKNSGAQDITAPLMVVIDSISAQSVTVGNADGTTPDGKPYFLYQAEISGNALEVNEISDVKKWIFSNPAAARFTYTAKVYTDADGDSRPPEIAITNPVDMANISTEHPLITIRLKDDVAIDISSFSAKINNVESSSLFNVTANEATLQVTNQLVTGDNHLSVSISDQAGNPQTAESSFIVSSSPEPVRYLFSLADSDWVFASPGNGTYTEYLNKNDLGIPPFSDVSAVSQITPNGNIYFSLAGWDGIYISPADGTNSIFYTNSELGLSPGDQVVSNHIGFSAETYYTIDGYPDILQSSGNQTHSTYMINGSLGLSITDVIQALHIGYDNTVYFANPNQEAILKSGGTGSNTPFLTAAQLGVPGSKLNAFAILPETTPPTITISSPINGAFINSTTPNITVNFSDSESGINPTSFQAKINGLDVTSKFTVTASGASYQVSSAEPLPVGGNTIYAAVNDRAGNGKSAVSNFTLGVLRAIPGATPLSGAAPLTVTYTSNGEDPLGTIIVYRWDWDNNGTYDTYDTVAQNYTRTYNSPGTYTSRLQVTSSTGNKTDALISVVVQNNPPNATANVLPSNGAIPMTAQLLGSGSDPDGTIVLYEWDFDGDGTYDWSSTTTGNTTHVYNTVGTFNASFRVTDNSGQTATAYATTTVIRTGPPGSPTATASASPASGNAPLNVNLTGSATDPENNVVLYEWDFDGDGTYDWSNPSTGNTSHTYTAAGIHIATLRVTDATGLTGIDQVLVTVNIQTSISIQKNTVGFLPTVGEFTGAAASTAYSSSSSYQPSNAIDGNTGTYWHSAAESVAGNSYFEVTFIRPQKVSGIGIDWYSTSYKYNRARIDAFDIDGNSLYSQEHDINGDPSTVSLPQIENVMRIRMTAVTKQSSYTIIYEFSADSVPMPTGGMPEPTGTNVNTTLSSGAQVSILIKDALGNVVRKLVDNEFRNQGSYQDYWNCKDDGGFVVNDGTYYAGLQYVVNGEVKELDLTGTTGGTRYSFPTGGGCDQRDAMSKTTFSPYNDEFSPITFRLCNAGEVTVFIGPLYQGGSETRIRTILNRKVLPAGRHTIYWDGLDDQGHIAHPNSGDSLILGMWRYSLPNNAMVMTGTSPVISNVSSDPNYYNPFSHTCIANGSGVTVTYQVSEAASRVELKVINLDTSNVINTLNAYNVPAGQNQIYWNGMTDDGKYASPGDYQISLVAVDSDGNQSLFAFVNLIRIFY